MQRRLKAIGLTQRTLGRLLGYGESKMSRHLRGHLQSGVPQNVLAAIVAWEVMTPEQRELWVAKVTQEGRDLAKGVAEEPTDLSAAAFRSLEKKIRDLTQALEKAKARR